MDAAALTDNHQQMLDQVAEATALLELVPGLLEENARLAAEAQAAQTDLERLRAEVEPLRTEAQRGRADREELIEAFGKVMNDMGQLMAEFAPRFRFPLRPSPFAREPHNGQGNGAGGNGHAFGGGPVNGSAHGANGHGGAGAR